MAAEDGTPLVSADAVAERWSRRDRENVILFDVRTREEYDAGHVPGSSWVPGGQAVQATDDNMAVRAGWLVLICDGFGRSIMTAGWLKRMGFPHVAVLEGGVPAWQRSAARSRPASRSPRRSASRPRAVWSSRCRPGPSATRWW